jgi:urease accessory protein UreF
MRPNEKSARPDALGAEAARSEVEYLPGDFSALLRRLGAPGAVPEAARPFWTAAFGPPPAPGQFLQDYLSCLLLPCELPAIVAAWDHARRGRWRELVAQDRRLDGALLTTPFAEPSRRTGWLQLTRLRPLRDERMVRRYLSAVESGQASGWHTVVYGLTLAVYSLPLRQGLLHYARETLSALAAASRPINHDESEPSPTLEVLLARVPPAVEECLSVWERAENDSMRLSGARYIRV